MKRTNYIVANWKMNGSINFISEFLNDLDNLAFKNMLSSLKNYQILTNSLASK